MRDTNKFSILLLVMVLGDPGCVGHNTCDYKFISQTKSQDRKYVATVYHRTCNTGWHDTSVVLTEPRFLDPSSSSPYMETHVVVLTGSHPLNVAWKDATHLVITIPSLAEDDVEDVKRSLNGAYKTWRNVSIEYR